MPAPIESVVNVSIELATASVEQAGFGTALIAGYHTKYADLVRTYSGSTGIADMATDGFAANHPIRMAAAALLSQNPKVEEFKIGKLSESDKQSIKIVPVAFNSRAYSITIGGEVATYTSDGSATVAEICTGLTSAINALSGAFTAVDGTTMVTVTADADETAFEYTEYDHALLQLTDVTGTNSALSDDLDDIQEFDGDWYALILANQPEADINAAATWVEAQTKIFLANSPDYAIITSATTDVMSDIETGAYSRTSMWFHKFPGEYLGAAVLGDILPRAPGSYTAHMKNLSGVSVDDIKSASITFINDKTGNYYVEIGGSNRTFNGQMGSGDFIDTIVFGDWLKARMQERLLGILFNSPKLPYTRGGLAVIESEIRAQLLEGARVGGLNLETSPVISIPDLADISANDKANRIVQNVTFSATLAGAIHKIVINGTLTL